MLALWLLHVAAGAGLLRHGASCGSCLALHPAVLGREGTEEVCVGKEERYDAGCSKCTAARGECRAPSLLQQRLRSRGCPPPQPCTCNCNCPEIVFPVPPPLPLLPTPLPGLLQTGATVNLQTGALPSFLQTAARATSGSTATVQRRSWTQQGQPVPGMALPPPGAPINMLPPPPMPPLPPMPPDPRVQECPVNTPCTCYCHCKNPPAAAAGELFAPPRPTTTPAPTTPMVWNGTVPTTPPPPAAAAAAPAPAPAAFPDPKDTPCDPLEWTGLLDKSHAHRRC